MHLHKWGIWKSYQNENTYKKMISGFEYKEIEERQERHCTICNKKQDKLIRRINLRFEKEFAEKIKDLNIRISKLEHPAKYKINDKVRAMCNVGCLGYDEVKGIITEITIELNEWGFSWKYNIFNGKTNVIVSENNIMEKIK